MKKSKILIGTVLSIILLSPFHKKNHFYKNIKMINNPEDLDILVNKNNKLDSNYVPNDLELLDIKYAYENKYLRKEAKEMFEKLSEDANQEGYRIIATSAYRDYNYQNVLYNHYVKEKGKKYADMCSARAGHSEHQTGLAVDVAGSNDSYDDFEETKEFNWMQKNAHKYGFILRYPRDKEHITGFKYEPWHYRYIGVNVATIIYEKNITLEEYKNDRT